MTAAHDHPVVLFDGVCNLCTGSVRFIIDRDPSDQFRFATLGSGPAQVLLTDILGRVPAAESVVLVENGTVYTRSTAVLRIARRLRWPWRLAYILVAVPRPIRDWFYRLTARHRYAWFGKNDSCMVPTPELRERFLA